MESSDSGSNSGVDRMPYTANVLAAVAEAEGEDVTEMGPPLGDVIDAEALEVLLQSSDADTRVSFTYRDWKVEVQADGTVTVIDPATGEDRLYLCLCYTCTEREIMDGLEHAQEWFTDHVERGHKAEILRRETELADVFPLPDEGDAPVDKSSRSSGR